MSIKVLDTDLFESLTRVWQLPRVHSLARKAALCSFSHLVPHSRGAAYRWCHCWHQLEAVVSQRQPPAICKDDEACSSHSCHPHRQLGTMLWQLLVPCSTEQLLNSWLTTVASIAAPLVTMVAVRATLLINWTEQLYFLQAVREPATLPPFFPLEHYFFILLCVTVHTLHVAL